MLPASPRRSWPTSLLLGAPSLIPRGILRPFVAPAHDVSPLAHSLPLYLSTSSRHTQQTQKPKPLAPHEQSAREHNTHHHVPNSNDTVGWLGGAAGTAEKLPAQKPKPYQREKATSIPWWNFRWRENFSLKIECAAVDARCQLGGGRADGCVKRSCNLAALQV